MQGAQQTTESNRCGASQTSAVREEQQQETSLKRKGGHANIQNRATIIRLWSALTEERHNSAMKQNKWLIHLRTQRNVKNIVLSERNQAEKEHIV